MAFTSSKTVVLAMGVVGLLGGPIQTGPSACLGLRLRNHVVHTVDMQIAPPEDEATRNKSDLQAAGSETPASDENSDSDSDFFPLDDKFKQVTFRADADSDDSEFDILSGEMVPLNVHEDHGEISGLPDSDFLDPLEGSASNLSVSRQYETALQGVADEITQLITQLEQKASGLQYEAAELPDSDFLDPLEGSASDLPVSRQYETAVQDVADEITKFNKSKLTARNHERHIHRRVSQRVYSYLKSKFTARNHERHVQRRVSQRVYSYLPAGEEKEDARVFVYESSFTQDEPNKVVKLTYDQFMDAVRPFVEKEETGTNLGDIDVLTEVFQEKADGLKIEMTESEKEDLLLQLETFASYKPAFRDFFSLLANHDEVALRSLQPEGQPNPEGNSWLDSVEIGEEKSASSTSVDNGFGAGYYPAERKWVDENDDVDVGPKEAPIKPDDSLKRLTSSFKWFKPSF